MRRSEKRKLKIDLESKNQQSKIKSRIWCILKRWCEEIKLIIIFSITVELINWRQIWKHFAHHSHHSFLLSQGGFTSFCCLLIWFDLMQHHFVHYEKGTTLISFNKINLIKISTWMCMMKFFLDWSSWLLNYEFVFETHKNRHNNSPKKCSHQLLSAVSRLLLKGVWQSIKKSKSKKRKRSLRISTSLGIKTLICDNLQLLKKEILFAFWLT